MNPLNFVAKQRCTDYWTNEHKVLFSIYSLQVLGEYIMVVSLTRIFSGSQQVLQRGGGGGGVGVSTFTCHLDYIGLNIQAEVGGI